MHDEHLAAGHRGRDVRWVSRILAYLLLRFRPRRGSRRVKDLKFGDSHRAAERRQGTGEGTGRHERIADGQDADGCGLAHG